jgi:surface protein
MSGMFYDCSSLLSLPDISKWDTSNVSDMSCMFSGCKQLLSLPDISKWNTSNVTNMRNMFGACRFHRYYSSCSSLKLYLIFQNGIFLMLLI